MTGIYDISNGQCRAAASLRGKYIRCDLAREHDGWDHQSIPHELIWTDRQAYTPEPAGSSKEDG